MIHNVKIQVAVDKYGIPLAIDVSPANRHDGKGVVPVLRQLASRGFRGSAGGISATGTSVWPRRARRSASPSRQSPPPGLRAR